MRPSGIDKQTMEALLMNGQKTIQTKEPTIGIRRPLVSRIYYAFSFIWHKRTSRGLKQCPFTGITRNDRFTDHQFSPSPESIPDDRPGNEPDKKGGLLPGTIKVLFRHSCSVDWASRHKPETFACLRRATRKNRSITESSSSTPAETHRPWLFHLFHKILKRGRKNR